MSSTNQRSRKMKAPRQIGHQPPWFDSNLEYVMSYDAKLREPEVVGPIPEGVRLNFYVTGGSFTGPKCKGIVLPVGGDWLTIRSDGVGILDVRATMQTDDQALIYIAYSGVLDLGTNGYKNAVKGTFPDGIQLRVVSRMHTAHPKYQWMNRFQYVQFGDCNLPTLTVRYDVYAMR
jgi:uncharacterized protein DUF3237